jgi:hypothetical protein
LLRMACSLVGGRTEAEMRAPRASSPVKGLKNMVFDQTGV